MTQTEQLLEKEIELEQYVESYKNDFTVSVLSLYRDLSADARKILQSYFGTRITVRIQTEINRELKVSIESFKEKLNQLVASETEKATSSISEMEKNKIENITRKDVVVPLIAIASLLKLQIPLEEGRVVSISGMVDGIVTGIERDLRTIVTRMRVINEADSTVAGYFNNTIRKNQNFLNVIGATIIALIANRIKYLYALENKEMFQGYIWVSIIDGKTSDYCIYRHTLYWDFYDSSKSTLPAEEYPPGHFRCRSGISYVMRGESIPDIPSYEEWFERQPVSVKRDILGPGRYELYREGELKISEFLDADSGRRLTLEQLRAKI